MDGLKSSKDFVILVLGLKQGSGEFGSSHGSGGSERPGAKAGDLALGLLLLPVFALLL